MLDESARRPTLGGGSGRLKCGWVCVVSGETPGEHNVLPCFGRGTGRVLSVVCFVVEYEGAR